MKNVRLLIILIALIAFSSITFTAVSASAADISPRNVNFYESPNGYTLTSVMDNGKAVGVSFYGIYFGSSDIAVSVNIFGESDFLLDFPVNEENSNLTEAQRANKAKLIALTDSIDKFIRQVDSAANTQYDGSGNKPVSDIYRYNIAEFGQKLEIGEHTYKMLQIAREMYLATNGAFNPAVYRLVDLWGFSSRVYSNGNFGLPYDRAVTAEYFFNQGYPLPNQKYITAFSDPAFTDFSDNAVTLSQEDGKFYVTKNVPAAVVDGEKYEQWLDLGGIAKGYVVDVIKSMLSYQGFVRYSVDAGTSSQAYGKNYYGSKYDLGITDPFENTLLSPSILSVAIADNAVSTSGQYIRKYTTDGVEYSHIVDGSLGKPAQTGIKLVSVVAPDNNFWASKGDCLTTALTVMGRDRIIDFMNGYLKDNDIKVIVAYETVDGQKQILSNYSQSEVNKGDTYDNFAWAVKVGDNGEFEYDFEAKTPVKANNFTWLIITLGVIVGVAVIVVIVIQIVKGKDKIERNVLNAKRDKPFKAGDVGVYLAVVLLIVILFAAFFGGEAEQQVKVIKVVDFSKSSEGEQLFVYNVTRNEWQINYDNVNGWTIDVTEEGNNLKIKFTRNFDGEEHFNVMTVTRGAAVSVKMTDSVCGRNQECVRNFGAITVPNGTIVCSPNRLKIITE